MSKEITTPSQELRTWPDRLERVLDAQCDILRRVFILAETDSTQDAARRMNACAGDVIITGNQTAGRGRLRRSWQGGGDGIAMTIVQPAERSERYAIAAGVGAARALNEVQHAEQPMVRIKWPNDLYVEKRKLGGILVEQRGNVALIGIGINVAQREWPDDLRDRAISLRELGCDASRLRVLEALLPQLDAALQYSTESLAAAFASLDLLTGRTIRARCGEHIITGLVHSIDPLRGLAIEAPGKHTLQWCSAALTTVLSLTENTSSA